MKIQKILAIIMAVILSASVLGGCNEDTSEADTTTTAAPETTTAEAPETTTAAPEPEKEETVLNVAVDEMAYVFNPAFAEAEGDKQINTLIHAPLLTIDRSGKVLYAASEGASSAYHGAEYTYPGIADVTYAYDSAADITTFTVSLKQGVKFSDGEEMTADDVIFTYYVLCDASYNGPSSVKNQIVGVEAYQKNNSAAPGVTVTEEEISKALGEPTEELKNAIIEQITRPVLEEEKAWCEANWQKYVDRGYGDSAEEFFVTLYTSTVNADYSIEGKTFNDIVDETVKMFGMNYKALAKNYQGDIDFFDAQVEQITEEILYQAKLTAAGGVPVPNIAGIRKINEYTVQIDSAGNDGQKIYSVCNIRVIPLHYYGDDNQFDIEANKFGLTRGDLSSVMEKSGAPVGAGPYSYVSMEDGSVILEGNSYYFAGAPEGYQMKLTYVPAEGRLDAVIGGTIDAAQIAYDQAAEAAIGTADGELSTALYPRPDYYYFGLNASRLKVGEDANSEQSTALRTAFAVLLAANRQSVGEKYMGSTAAVVEYPFTSSSWTVPAEDSGLYQAAFDMMPDGTPIYNEVNDAEGRMTAAMDAAREYLIKAGYKYSEDESVFTEAPEGAVMDFMALVPYYFAGDTAMVNILEQVKAVFETWGFTLQIDTAEDIDEFGYSLAEKYYDVWCGERSTFIEPQIYKYYHSSGSSNYYGLNITELDAALEGVRKTYDFDERAAAYGNIYSMIRDAAVEVPAYQRQEAVIYRIDKIAGDSIPVISEYFDMMDGMSLLKINSEE